VLGTTCWQYFGAHVDLDLVERNPTGTLTLLTLTGTLTLDIRSKSAFVLVGFRSSGTFPARTRSPYPST